jgi:hypothetical protein
MNTFKRKALTCAVLAGLGAVATTAEAVYRNPDNTGQVLIYPYYTVQAGFTNYISIVNTTSRAKAVKIRFREGKTSAEVEDHNVFLSPNDVYVAIVFASGPNATDPARIQAGGDLSCTIPTFGASGFFDFRNYAYLASPDSLPQSDTSLDRTREGYVEVFEMATLTGTAAANVTHASGGAPTCTGVSAPFTLTSLEAPTGGLTGTLTLINTTTGADMGYTADALDQFINVANYQDPSSLLPGLSQAAPPVSLVLANGRGVQDTWLAGSGTTTAGSRAVAATFMHSTVTNEYVLDTATASNTDWVLTFPGKRDFVNATSAHWPFSNIVTTNGACEPVTFNFWNRDEATSSTPTSISPAPPTGSTPVLCFESTIVSIRNGNSTNTASGAVSGVLGSINNVAITVPSTFQNGWAKIAFQGQNSGVLGTRGLISTAGNDLTAAGVSTARAHTFAGLPVTGFMARTFKNATLPCTTSGGTATTCSVLFESNFAHGYQTIITP